jgi:hypothetical protein
MADVFISYSNLDRDRAQPIAASLEAEQISTWWDPNLRPGEVYDTEIEMQLTAAKCVIVLWSAASVNSKWVRSEATDADGRNILIPVSIGQVRPPLAFRLLQTTDLTDWNGDATAESWQRVILQVRALLGRPPEGAAPAPAEGAAAAISDKGMVLRASIAPLAALAVLVVALTIWGSKSGAGPFAIALGLALLAFLLFRLAEHDLSPHMKALAARWLLPKTNQFRVGTAEAFNYLFEAVFGRTHFSAECFVKSTLISTAFLAIILVIAMMIFGDQVHHTPSTVIGVFLFGFTVNVVGDYLALLKTRLLLRSYKAGVNIVFILLVDVIGIIVIFAGVLTLAVLVIYGLLFIAGTQDFPSWRGYLGAVGRDVMEVLGQPVVDFLGYHLPIKRFPLPDKIMMYSSFLTMFMTSLWLWMALLLSPFVRLMIWSQFTGLTVIGYVFDVHKAPFAAMGYLCSFLILMTGTAVWGVGEVAAAVRFH